MIAARKQLQGAVMGSTHMRVWATDADGVMHRAIEDASTLVNVLLEKVADDMRHPDAAISADAYFWVVSPRSELYSDVADSIGVAFSYPQLRSWFVQRGVSLPDTPVSKVVLDTDDASLWCYCGASTDACARALLTHTDEAMRVCVAEVNGVRVEIVGSGARLLRQFLTHIRVLLAAPPRRGFSRSRYLERVMVENA